MDLTQLADKKVRDAAKKIQERRDSFEAGLDQARRLGLLAISRINVDKALEKIFRLADANRDAGMLDKLNAATSFSGKKHVTEHTTEEGRDRVRAVQLFKALEGDGSYPTVKANIERLPSSGKELRRLARDEKLLTDLDETSYVDVHKLLKTVDGSTGAISELHREWYLDQAALMEAYRSLEGTDPATQSLLVIVMLNSFAKATTMFDDEGKRLGYQMNPIFSQATIGAEYFRSTANRLLKQCASEICKKLDPGKAAELAAQVEVVHNATFREVLARAFAYEDVNLAVGNTAGFEKALDDALLELWDGTVPDHYFVFDVTELFATSGTTIPQIRTPFALDLEARARARIKAFLTAKKDSILVGPAPLEGSDQDEALMPIADLLRDVGKFLSKAVVAAVTQYRPPLPVMDNLGQAVHAAKDSPSGTHVVDCPDVRELQRVSNRATPKLETSGIIPGKNATLDAKLDLVLFPFFFNSIKREEFESIVQEVFPGEHGQQDKRPFLTEAIDKLVGASPAGVKWGANEDAFPVHLDHTITHTGYRPDPLTARKWWAGMSGYANVLKGAGVLVAEFATPGKTPVVCKSWEAFTQHQTVVEFGKLSKQGAAPYLKVYPAATVALLQGFTAYEPDETVIFDAWLEEAQKDPPYDGTATLSVSGAPGVYADDKCQAKAAPSISADDLRKQKRFYLKPGPKTGETVKLALGAASSKLIQVDPEAELKLGEGSGVDRAFRARGLTDLLQVSYFRMLNAMGEAMARQGEMIPFLNSIELIHQEIAAILTLLEPYPRDELQKAILAAMKTQAIIPAELEASARVHLRPSALHCLASLVAAVEKMKKSNRLNVAFLKDCYYEESFAIEEWHTYRRLTFDGDALTLGDHPLNDAKTDAATFGADVPIDVFVCDFHHNISIDRTRYKVEDLIGHVDLLFGKKGLVSDKLVVAIDCTVDLIASGDVKKFLDHFKAKITGKQMAVMLFRSGQKFDMLGLDNFYGGYSITIEQLGNADFGNRMNAPEDELDGANRQGHTHLARHAAKYLDQYREELMANTKRIYQALPAECIAGADRPGPMQVSESTDPRNVFLDIKFPFAPVDTDKDTTVGGAEIAVKNAFKEQLLSYAKKHKLPLTMRASFGFPTTNYSTIWGTKVRVNPGLEGTRQNDQWAGFLKALHAHLSTQLAREARAGADYVQKVADAIKTLPLP